MKYLKLVLLLVLALSSFKRADAKIIYVPGDALTIQAGINEALHGDTVLVAPGEYPEAINFMGKRILVASNYIFDPDSSVVESTIISGLGPKVTFALGEDSASAIKGFTITGLGMPYLGNRGVYCCNSSPVIAYNIIMENQVWVYMYEVGAGIYCDYSHPLIKQNVIKGNVACWGAGIYLTNSSRPIIDANVIESNYTISGLFVGSGAGIGSYENSNPVIRNNLITENWVDVGDGGGISCDSAVICNNTIVANAANIGGGIACGPAIVTNNNICSNYGGGGGIAASMSSNPVISYNNVWNNTDWNFHGCPAGVGDTTWGTNFNYIPCDSFYNIIRDPIFVDAQAEDFHLQWDSPCIDAGDNNAPGLPEKDFDGKLRIWDGNRDDTAIVDMGAFEFRPHICQTVNVPADYPTIQEAIDAAMDCDTVLVARGYYCERISLHGKRILVVSNFIFDHDGTTIDSTIIDGDNAGSVVTFSSGEDSTSIIEGFTITNGNASVGGGVYCQSSSPTIRNNMIEGNSASSGGGISCRESSPIIINNRITGNSAQSGGGIFCDRDCLSLIINNTINGNSASSIGGGIMCDWNASPIITNNIISNSVDGEGIHAIDEAWPTIAFNDVWNNADSNFSGCPPGVGDTTRGTNFNHIPCDSFFNIIRDPLFADTISYALLCSSACIDAGDSTFEVPDSGGRRIDIGVYEYPYIMGDANQDGGINIVDVVYLVNYLFRSGPQPCPLGKGDVECNSFVDIVDVVYLINYLFRSGPEPGCH